MRYAARIYPPGHSGPSPLPGQVWRERYRAPLKDGSALELPLTPLPGGEGAIALLMSNQCDFTVTDHLADLLAAEAAALRPDCIAAVPTMGLEYGGLVARKLGQANYAALGFSQKFWYDDVYEEIRSSTSSSQVKRLYLDPHLWDRVRNKRVLIVDDVINTGASVLAAIRLLRRLGAEVIATLVVLTEGRVWESTLAAPLIAGSSTVQGLGHIPLFVRQGDGWAAAEATL